MTEKVIRAAEPLTAVSVTREWGDGEYTFSMGRNEWRKIDKQFDVGPFEFLRRLSFGTWKPDYPREVIRLALQAGGSVTNEAGIIDDKRINRLIADYVDDRLFQAALFAADILTAMAFPPVSTEPSSEQTQDTSTSLDESQRAPVSEGVALDGI